MNEYLARGLTGIAFLTLSVGLLLSTTVFVHAQTSSEGVEIKPGVVEDRVNPGDIYRFSLKVKNLFTTDQTFYILKEDIAGLDEQGQPLFAAPGQATGYELSTWITTPGESVTLKAGEERGIPFVVHVPKEATPGSHFGGVFFNARAPKIDTSGAGIGIQVGSVVSLRINGEVTEDARLREFSSAKAIYNSPNVDFKIRMENLGNVLLRPHGVIDITDMRGKKVATVRVNESAGPIFPGTDRIYTPNWTYDRFGFGRYQAVLSVVYGEDGRKTVSSVTSFWVLPIKPILTLLGVLLAIVIVLYLVVKMYIRKKLREMGVVGKKGEGDYYGKKYNRSASRMLVTVSVIFLFCVVALVALFVMFA